MMKRLNQADNKVTFENVTFYLDLRSNPGIRGRLCLGIQTLKGVSVVFILYFGQIFCCLNFIDLRFISLLLSLFSDCFRIPQ